MTDQTSSDREVLELIQAETSGIYAEMQTLNSRMLTQEELNVVNAELIRKQGKIIGDINDEVYGNDIKRIPGLKRQAQITHDLIERGKGVLWLIGLAGLTNIVAVLWLAARVR